MSDVLRSTTFQLEFQGQDGVTGIKQFTRAVSDADKTVDELSATLGNNVTVTYKTVRSAQELTAEARALVAQMERTNSAVKSLTEQYNHQAAMIGKTAQEQEVLNAVYKLGANATTEQKQQITQLVQNYQRLRDGANGTQGSFRNLRGVSQQVGWQLQDVAVQAQMGTSAFVILSQQGSQLAAAFGPTGALVGAAIAVIGALAGVAYAAANTKQNIQDLERVTKTLAQVRVDNLTAVNDLIRDAADPAVIAKYKSLNDEFLTTTTELENQKRFTEQLTKARQEAADAAKETDWKGAFKPEDQARFNDLTRQYNDALTREAELTSKINGIKKEQSELSKQGEKDKKAEEKAAKKAASEAEKAAKKAIADAARLTKQKESAFNAETLSLVKQTETIEEEYRRRKAVIDDYVKHSGSDKRTDEAYAVLEQWRTQELTKETDKRIAEYQRREDARKQIEKGQNKTLGILGGDDTEASKYEANLRVLSEQHSQVEKETQRHLLALKQARDNGKLTKDQYDLAVAQVNNEGLSEQQRINALKEGEEARHIKAMSDYQIQLLDAQLTSLASASMMMSSTVDIISQGAEEVKNKTAEMNAFQKAMFFLNQSIAAAMAFINGISLGSKLAEMFPLAAPAMIATGTAIGAAQSGAIMGATFAGTFDNGGYIPPGQNGIVSEYGDELVNGVLVKGPARVTSREDTAAAMSGGASSVKILIENKIDGATYTTQQIDENTVKVIAEKVFNQNIDSGVSNVLGNRNSKATKQLKSNFNVRGKY